MHSSSLINYIAWLHVWLMPLLLLCAAVNGEVPAGDKESVGAAEALLQELAAIKQQVSMRMHQRHPCQTTAPKLAFFSYCGTLQLDAC
jgi:hypothetical protein